MFSNKHILILLLLIVGICAISSVSAADDVSEVVTADDAQVDEVATVIEEEVAAVEETDTVAAQEDDDKVSASEDAQIVSKDESSDVLSYSPFPDADDYDISFKYSSYILSGSLNDKKVYYSITPCKSLGYYAYDYSLRIYDGYTKDGNSYYWGNKIYDSGRIYGSDISKKQKCILPYRQEHLLQEHFIWF